MVCRRLKSGLTQLVPEWALGSEKWHLLKWKWHLLKWKCHLLKWKWHSWKWKLSRSACPRTGPASKTPICNTIFNTIFNTNLQHQFPKHQFAGHWYFLTFGGLVCWKKIPDVHRSNRKLQDSEIHFWSPVGHQKDSTNASSSLMYWAWQYTLSRKSAYVSLHGISEQQSHQVVGRERKTWQTPARSPASESDTCDSCV